MPLDCHQPSEVVAIPERERVSARHQADELRAGAKAAYAIGGTTDILGHWLYHALANPVFVTQLRVSPTQLSTALFASRLVDAFTDPLFGWLSDNTRSKWGRRRPYLLLGSVLAGLALPGLFMVSPSWNSSQVFWFMVCSACLYAPLIGIYNAPYQSLGAELTPDYDERTSVMSWRAAIQTGAAMLLNWAWWFASRPVFNDPRTGQPDLARGARWAASIAGGLMVISGIVSFALVRERYYGKASAQTKTAFSTSLKQALACRPYLTLLGTGVLFAVPTALVGHLGYYVQTYYVFHGDAVAASEIGGWSGVAYGVFSLVGVPAASAASNKFGKRRALEYTLLFAVVALGSVYWLYTPLVPWLCVVGAGLYGFVSACVWVILPSMAADVVDFDELTTHQRREGAFSSIFSWILKVGVAVSTLMAGPLLASAGFDSGIKAQAPATVQTIRLMFAALPSLACLLAVLLISRYPLTRAGMQAVRTALEARRGVV